MLNLFPLSIGHVKHVGYLIESGRQQKFGRNLPMLEADMAVLTLLDPPTGRQFVRSAHGGAGTALGVEDGLLEVEGVTLPMAVALGEGDVKSVEDLAGLIPDDLRGWFETKDGERVREKGILESFNMDPADAEALIMRARVAMGWIEAPEPEPEVEEEVEYNEAEAVFGQRPAAAVAPEADAEADPDQPTEA